MSALDDMQEAGIPVNWSTVRLGLEGTGQRGPQIGVDDVRAWLENELTRGIMVPLAVEAMTLIDNGTRSPEFVRELELLCRHTQTWSS
jgi:hypothetical protein